jgi:diaminohydroxyphosphoribosylaminopyrimidine deaminase/5-amino-6-(5-phosphoribosylamino)uracil reductase
MQRCLDLALNGMGTVSPNPMVGCVLVHEGKIIGEGFHRNYGGPHAEVYAINSVKDASLLSKATLYVNLEPCSHHGKTPPCADLIIEKGISEVVIACVDVNPTVAGKGIKKLQLSGIKVSTGLLETEAIELNKRFFTFHQKQRPYIILKWAQTLDGFIDVERKPGTHAAPTWITSDALKPLVHKWRTEEDAIMVGTKTVLMDNPQLTAREWSGKNPLRIFIDQHLQVPNDFHLLDGSTPTWVLCSTKPAHPANAEYIQMDFSEDILMPLMDKLHQHGIQSLIVEGGLQLLQSFIDEGLWDEARVFTGHKYFGKGVEGPVFNAVPFEVIRYDNDVLAVFSHIGKA